MEIICKKVIDDKTVYFIKMERLFLLELTSGQHHKPVLATRSALCSNLNLELDLDLAVKIDQYWLLINNNKTSL